MLLQLRRLSLRAFSSTTRTLAPPAKPARKQKVQFKPGAGKSGERATPKKGGMTHHEFKDAVGHLKLHKQAPVVENVPRLSADKLDELCGSVARYSAQNYKALRSIGDFHRSQHVELFRKPVALVSHNTRAIADEFVAKIHTSESKDNRVLLVGEKGVGKTTVLTQAHAMAREKPIVLLHLPEGRELVDGSNDYLYNSGLDKYQQPMLTKRWLTKIRKLNEATLRQMPLSRDATFSFNRKTFNLKKGENSLFEYLEQNNDFSKAAPTKLFQFFIEELQHHSEKFPVVVSMDNANAFIDSHITKYRDTAFVPIRSTQFEVADFFLRVAGGGISFKKGGVLLAEASDVPPRYTLKVAAGLCEYDPYLPKDVFDVDVANMLRANGQMKVLEVTKFSKDEARSMLEFYEKAGVLWKEVDEAVEECYSMSGGNPRGLLKAVAFAY